MTLIEEFRAWYSGYVTAIDDLEVKPDDGSFEDKSPVFTRDDLYAAFTAGTDNGIPSIADWAKARRTGICPVCSRPFTTEPGRRSCADAHVRFVRAFRPSGPAGEGQY